MPKPSAAQAKILARIKAGGKLALDAKTGRYAFTEMHGKVCAIDQRPVLVMIREGLLIQSLTGECRPG